MDSVNIFPRRVWFGLYIPGKKLFRLDAGYPTPWISTQRASMLIDCYKDDPSVALVYAAMGLHLVPENGAAFGPAIRDLRRQPLRPGLSYGAILTDIRDFLKFRYRAKGLDVSASELLRELHDGHLLDNVVSEDPAMAINYAISALDALSRDAGFIEEQQKFVAAIYQLRDLLEGAAKFLKRLEVGEERWQSYVERDWGFGLPWKPTP